MNRVVPLVLVSLMLFTGIASCKCSEPIPTDMPEADSITIWFQGKGINLEKGNSIFEKLSIEAVRVINELDGNIYYIVDGSGISAIDRHKQNDKCLEIEFTEPYRRFKFNMLEDDFVISVVLFPFSKDYIDHWFKTYSENSKHWYTWTSRRSTEKLLDMVDEYLGVLP
jgi:hypothetical protein